MEGFRDKKIFISGGNGVIGNYLVNLLHASGARLYVGDLKPRPLNWPADIIYRQGDLNYITRKELEHFGPEYFFHLAATFERSAETYEFWDENRWHNVHLSTYLMGLLKDSPSLKHVIFASSYLIYDPALYLFSSPAEKAVPLRESDPVYPRNLTGVAKLNHEIELRFVDEFRKDAIRTVCARIYRSYGKNSMDVISRWVRDLLAGKELTVYRSEGMFDYVYAGDVAEGLARLAQSNARGIVNLGRGEGRRVSEVLNILRSHFPGMKTREMPSDIPWEASCAQMDRFYSLTGWKPGKRPEDAIPEIIDYEIKRISEPAKPVFHVMVSSASGKIPMLKAVKHSMDKFGTGMKLFSADLDPACLARHFTDEFWQMPGTIKDNFTEILNYCRKNGIGMIIPSRDGELPFWSEVKPALNGQGIGVMVSSPEVIHICRDKLLFYNELKKNGFPVIPTALSPDDLEFKGKYVVKERFGAGSRNIHLNLGAEEALKAACGMSEPVFQPYIEGIEYSADAWVGSNGRVKGVVTRVREKVVNGESQITRAVEDKEMSLMLTRLFESKAFYGHVIAQVIKDPAGKHHLVEINCRFGGASTLSLACGLDSFYWLLLEHSGNNTEEYPFLPEYGKLQIRYPNDLITDGTGF